MTPEETVNQEFLYVLNRIKKEVLIVGEQSLFHYENSHFFASGIPSSDHQDKIVNQLVSAGVIQSQYSEYQRSGMLKVPSLDRLNAEIKKYDKKHENIFQNILPENRGAALRLCREVRQLENISADGKVYFGANGVSISTHNADMVFAEKLAKLGLWDFLGADDISGDGIIDDIDVTSLNKIIELLEQALKSQITPTLQIDNPWDTFTKDQNGHEFIFIIFTRTYKVTFSDSQKENLRLSIFDAITSKQGEAVATADISKANDCSEEQVKTTINQINLENLIDLPIRLLPTNKGSYRASFLYPTK